MTADVVLVGGGLANSLIALRLRPQNTSTMLASRLTRLASHTRVMRPRATASAAAGADHESIGAPPGPIVAEQRRPPTGSESDSVDDLPEAGLQ